ncbi:hypothetical protein [Notoacmeibacter sp. MSK16QG-6]|uniref:hypothetical protein n=1 Tax=Notoacmeibacter sp. MSK16QG-6 TaxID=2957982 RepID=UPI00209DDE4B|nr:hypothetical protein [Notoacmeibacter sp. MSK16QG-6]MCP1199222.1 hypothetical protein [Notoacmeibacter sp. MSK16QG-6]
MKNGLADDGRQSKGSLRRTSFDEFSKAIEAAARARSYPPELASLAGEMTLWCQRHRLPGLPAMVDHLEPAPRFDQQAAQPKPQKDGSVHFSDPVLGGLFIHHHYSDFQWPALIDGPKTGAVLFAAFLAMGAHERGDHLSIAFLGTDDRPAEAARLLYGEGRSLLEGDADVARLSRRIAIEKIAPESHPPLDEPLAESVPCDIAMLDRLLAIPAST